jgi:hypothetical protein
MRGYGGGVYTPDQTFWDDLRFPAQGLDPAGLSAPPTVDAADPFMGSLLFSPTLTNVVAGIAQMPHGWRQGTTLHPHIHWCPTTANAGNVAWRFSYQVSDIDGTFPASLTTAGIEVDAADGVQHKHQLHSFTAIDMSGKKISVIIIWKLERVVGGSDTYPDDARFLELDFHYEIDAVGSQFVFVK